MDTYWLVDRIYSGHSGMKEDTYSKDKYIAEDDMYQMTREMGSKPGT